MSTNSATVFPLRDYRIKRRPQFFTRPELNQLLGLYSRSVSRGVWRDYAIDHREGRALFSVFRHTQEAAIYTIVKSAASPSGPAEFVVMSGRQIDARRRTRVFPRQIGARRLRPRLNLHTRGGGSIRSRMPSRRTSPCISAAAMCSATRP
jgi:hypothetical protein